MEYDQGRRGQEILQGGGPHHGLGVCAESLRRVRGERGRPGRRDFVPTGRVPLHLCQDAKGGSGGGLDMLDTHRATSLAHTYTYHSKPPSTPQTDSRVPLLSPHPSTCPSPSLLPPQPPSQDPGFKFRGLVLHAVNASGITVGEWEVESSGAALFWIPPDCTYAAS